MMKNSIVVVMMALGLLANSARADSMIPIDLFSQVSPSLYRGAHPSNDALVALHSAGIKTDLDLEDSSDAIAAEQQAAASAGLQFISEPMSGIFAPSDARVGEIFTVLRNPANFPIFIHCEHGRDRTGLIVGLYRVFDQGWAPQTAYDEMVAIGFRPYLFTLRDYFDEKTGLHQ